MHEPSAPSSPLVTRALLAVVLLCVAPSLAHADDAEPALPPLRPAQRVLPTAAALVPGVLIHGSGTFLAGDRRTAKRLAISGGAGFGAFMLSGTLLAVTGTARRLVGPATSLMAAGTAVFFTSWLADIYGAATGGRPDTAADIVPQAEWEVGHRYVYDPQFSYRNFALVRGDLRHARLRASASGLIGLDDDNQRVSIDLAYRVRGRVPEARTRDASYLELASSLIYHRYGSERFAVWTPTLALEGRLDLHHVGESLRGSFVEGQLGAGIELYDFSAPGAQARDDAFGLLLARFGFGVYFTGRGERNGELLVYYDHRHDDLAAGLGIRGIGGGVLGHVGVSGHAYLGPNWGVGAQLEGGSAVIAGLSLRYRARGS